MRLAVFSLIISVILESFLTTLPLTLCLIIFLAVTVRRAEVFFMAFFAGLALDVLSLGTLGISSLVFTAVVYIVFLYEKKFELETFSFIFLTTLIASVFYLLLTGREIIFQTVFATLISTASFLIFSHNNKKIPSYV